MHIAWKVLEELGQAPLSHVELLAQRLTPLVGETDGQADLVEQFHPALVIGPGTPGPCTKTLGRTLIPPS